MLSYENTITFIFFLPALFCVLIGIFALLTCGCSCFCNNEQETPPPFTRRRRRRGRGRTCLREHYIRMSDCESTHDTPTRPPSSWRCRGSGHPDVANLYRDRRLPSNFDTVVGPSPPSYTVTMQHNYSYNIWNQPSASLRRETSDGATCTGADEHSHVHNLSIRVIDGEMCDAETSLDDVEEVEDLDEKGEENLVPPPPYDKVTAKQTNTNGH